MNKVIELFYGFMYRKKRIGLKSGSGRNYIVEYRRSPFWSYEKPSLKLFFSEKINTWHGEIWLVYENGGRCGFGTNCLRTIYPGHKMKKFLVREVNNLERIFEGK